MFLSLNPLRKFSNKVAYRRSLIEDLTFNFRKVFGVIEFESGLKILKFKFKKISDYHKT